MSINVETLSTPGEVVRAMLCSISYNRDERHMIALALEVKNRIGGKFGCWTEDGSTVFGTLVCLYGDYGTSPRSGWIQTASVKEACCKALDDFIEEVKSNL